MEEKKKSWISNAALIIGASIIAGGLLDSDFTTAGRVGYVIMGIAICLIAKVSLIRWVVISVSCLLLGATGFSGIISGHTENDIINWVMVIVFFAVGSVYGYKSYRKFKPEATKGTNYRYAPIPTPQNYSQPVVQPAATSVPPLETLDKRIYVPQAPNSELEILSKAEMICSSDIMLDALTGDPPADAYNCADKPFYESAFKSEGNAPDIRDSFALYGGIEAELMTIDLMEGHDFEHWCANLLTEIGFANVDVTSGSGDQGVDILAEKDGLKYAIQCKRYRVDLGNTPVQEVFAGKSLYHCHVAAVLTNQYFRDSAKELAEATGVALWDRDWIKGHLAARAGADGSLIIDHSKMLKRQSHFDDDLGYDALLPVAIDIVMETGQVSVSMVQRRIQIGYARAARLIDEMEELGIVGPFQGSKPRAILITHEHWDDIKKQARNRAATER